MQSKYFLFIIFLPLVAFSISFSALSVSVSAKVTCSACVANDQCACDISDCTAGLLRFYASSDCSGTATSRLVFSTGSVDWTPTGTKSYYAKAFCDDGTTSPCSAKIAVSATQTTTTTTKATTPSIADCLYECCVGESGVRTVYCPSGQTCDNNVCVQTKSDCTDECCVSEANYIDKLCTGDATCANGKCVAPGPNIPYSLIGIIALIVVIVVLVFLFLMSRRKNEEGMWEALKGKWSGRVTKFFRK